MDSERTDRFGLDRRDFFKTAGAGLTAAAVMLTPREAALAQEAAEKVALERIASNTWPVRQLFKTRQSSAAADAAADARRREAFEARRAEREKEEAELAKDPNTTGAPGRTSWMNAIPARASASVWAATPADVAGAIAPARMNGVMIVAWLAAA